MGVLRVGSVENREFIIQYYQSFCFWGIGIEIGFWCGIVGLSVLVSDFVKGDYF